jgi:hypothetical protein
MSSKRGRSLADIVSAIDDEPGAPSTEPEPSVAREETAPAIVPINILVTPQDRRRLRQLSLDTGLSLQKLGHEAWNRLLESRGLPPLKPVAASVPSGRSRARHSPR